MIGSIIGKARTNRIVQTPSGVGYVVNCIVDLRPGEDVDMLVTTIVREDAIILYGFQSAAEQTLFEALIKVTGVGAALAMAMLADVGVGPTVAAIKERDTKALSKAKGLGVKRAEVICSTIKLSPELLALDNADSVASEAVTLSQTLIKMGWDEKAALEAAKVGLSKSPDMGTAIRAALNHLAASKGGAV